MKEGMYPATVAGYTRLMADAIRTKCLKCSLTIRAMDAETWENAVTQRQVRELSAAFRLWWVHGRKTTRCPAGGTHNPIDY
jgi:hypothetical protein